MDYRTTESESLLAAMGCALVAIDPEHGTLRWSVAFEWPVLRFYRLGSRVLVVTAQRVTCLEIADGRAVGRVEIGFQPQAGIQLGDSLVLATASALGSDDPRSIVCLTADGHIKWHAKMTNERRLSLFGPSNEPRGETVFTQREAEAGLGYGDVIVQPDFDG